MPKVMWQLLVYLFSGMPYSAIGKTPQRVLLYPFECYPKSNPAAYEEAVGWTGLVNGWYNIVTFLTAFALVGLPRNLVQSTHAFSLAASISSFPTHTG
jgi:maltose/moltooligosaccharide transporter